MEVLNNLDLQQNQLLNVVIHALSSAPTTPAPVDAQLYFNTGDRKIYSYKAATSTWEAQGGGTVVGGDGLYESLSGGVLTLSVNVDGATLETYLDTVRVKDGGIITAKLATDAVTTAKVLNSAITFAKMQNISAMTVIGRTAAGSGVASEITLINDSTLATGTATNIATAASVKAYIDSVVAAVGSLIGAFNATTNTIFPGISTTKKGDYWYVSVAGTVQGVTFNVGDVLIANKANPSTTLATDWIFLETNRDQASASILGLVFLATNAEVQTGTDANKVVTPASLSARTATETRTGIAKIATQAITDAGTNDTDFVTPLKMKTYVATLISVGSYGVVIGDASATSFTITHGLNSTDVFVVVRKMSDGGEVMVDNRSTGANTVVLNFAKAPALNSYKVYVRR